MTTVNINNNDILEKVNSINLLSHLNDVEEFNNRDDLKELKTNLKLIKDKLDSLAELKNAVNDVEEFTNDNDPKIKLLKDLFSNFSTVQSKISLLPPAAQESVKEPVTAPEPEPEPEAEPEAVEAVPEPEAEPADEALSEEDKRIKDLQNKLIDPKYLPQIQKTYPSVEQKKITYDFLQKNKPRIESIKSAIYHLKYNNELKSNGKDKLVANYDEADLRKIIDIIYNPKKQLNPLQGWSLGQEILGGKKGKTLKSKRTKKNGSLKKRK
jgi:hypothetical protein